MSLPMREAPSFEIKLPLSERLVKFRPFLVKEQKNMMVSGQGETENDTFKAIVEMIKSVSDLKEDSKKIPLADLEYLFLHIRSKSVGETAKMQTICSNNDCLKPVIVDVDLTQTEIDLSNLQSRDIEINDEMTIELRYPTAETAYKLSALEPEEASKVMLRECMLRLHDQEKSYEFLEYRNKEIDDFIDNLTLGEFEKLSEFFISLPQVEIESKYKCENCGNEDTVISRGLQSFF